MPTLQGPFSTGKFCTLCSVAAMTLSSSTLTAATPTSLIGRFDDWEYDDQPSLTDIHSATALVANNVFLFADFTLTITEIIAADGSSTLMDLSIPGSPTAYGQYIQFTGQSTAGSAGKTLTVVGVSAGVRYSMGEGKKTAVLTLKAASVEAVWA